MKNMKNKEGFIKALNTLFGSWGGDTPPEAYWAANDLLDWYESEFDLDLKIRFNEPDSLPPNYNNPDNFDEVIDSIRNIG